MTDPAPAVDGRRPMPTPTRVAVILLALLGVLLLAYTALIWFGQEVMIDQIADTGVSRESAAQTVLLFGLAYLVIGATATLSAIFLPLRRSWARLTGVLVTSLLTVMMLLSVLFTGSVNALSLLVLISAIAGLTSLMSSATKQWLREAPTA